MLPELAALMYWTHNHVQRYLQPCAIALLFRDPLGPRQSCQQRPHKKYIFSARTERAGCLTGNADDGRNPDTEECAPSDEAYASLNVALLTATIRSKRWWAYGFMVRTLNGFSEGFAAWAEGCECHAWLHPTPSNRLAPGEARFSPEVLALESCRRQLRLPRGVADGLHCRPCPLAGCKACDLASGAIDEHFEVLAACYNDTLLKATAGLQLADMGMVMAQQGCRG